MEHHDRAGPASRVAERAHTHNTTGEAAADDDGCRTSAREVAEDDDGCPPRQTCHALAGMLIPPSMDSFADCVLVIDVAAVDDANNWHDDDSAETNKEEVGNDDKEGGVVGDHGQEVEGDRDQEEEAVDHTQGNIVRNMMVVHQRQEVPGEQRSHRRVDCSKDCALLHMYTAAAADGAPHAADDAPHDAHPDNAAPLDDSQWETHWHSH